MGAAEVGQTRGTDFLFPFNHEFDVAGEGVRSDHIFECLGVHECLSFVVIGTASPDFAVFDDGFERVGMP